MTSSFSLAVHALVFLEHKAELLSSDALADNICTSPARVRRVLSLLKKAGLVETKEGAEGGYRFTLPGDQVTLAQVARALDARFVEANWKSGDVDKACLVSSGMAAVMDGLYADLDSLCLQRLEQLTLADISGRIFQSAV